MIFYQPRMNADETRMLMIEIIGLFTLLSHGERKEAIFE